MFAYIERDSLLHSINPVIKLAVLTVWTIVLCLSYYPVMPLITFVGAFILTLVLGKIPLKALLRQLVVIFAVSATFIFSMMVLRGLDPSGDIVLRFGFLGWTEKDLVHSVSLGFRIVALVAMSLSFVVTTRPRDLVLSLILQLKLSPVHGYAAMAAYRFVPELQKHVDGIHLAQEIRGIPWNRGVLSRFSSPFRVSIPLFIIAARQGANVANAMESRGLGRENARTYYRRTELKQRDWIYLVVMVGACAALCALLGYFDLFNFNLASIK